MNPHNDDSVVAALRDPDRLAVLGPAGWDVLVRQARSADLLERIAGLVDERGLAASIPAAPRVHLESAHILARAQQSEVRREVTHIRAALTPLGVPVIMTSPACKLKA